MSVLQMMSKKRAVIMVVCFWVFAMLLASSEYLAATKLIFDQDYSHRSYCEMVEEVRLNFCMQISFFFCCAAWHNFLSFLIHKCDNKRLYNDRREYI